LRKENSLNGSFSKKVRGACRRAGRIVSNEITEQYVSRHEALKTEMGLEVLQCDFMREIRWDSIDGSPLIADGHPWNASNFRVANNLPLTDDNWREDEKYRNSRLVESVKIVTDGIDEWLATLGFVREGEYYRVSENIPYKTVAMFSHAGASGAAISHILNIPFPQFCAGFHINSAKINN
jgi:probable phosphoglycerate mutase